MTSTVRRAGAFALVGTLSLAAPALNQATVVCFAAVAALSLFVIEEGTLFELFARPGDWKDRTLYSLAGFSLAAAGLAIFATLFGMPVPVFVASVLVLSYGNLAENLARSRRSTPLVATGAFVTGGTLAGTAGQAVVLAVERVPLVSTLSLFVFLATSGALLGALLRSALFRRDDSLVMVSIGLFLWLLAGLSGTVSALEVALGLGLTVALGGLSYGLGTASVTGMLTGMALVFLTIVLGGYEWFAVLIAFFGIGSFAAKYRFEEKCERGIAEDDDGARGSENVLANATVALAAVLAFAASSSLSITPEPFVFAFAGSLAAAMSDTLSSELGGLFDDPRLITTLEFVPPGTDGGVTWQGELAGLAGAAIIAGVAAALFVSIDARGAAVIAGAGVLGMTVDSVLGATIEGRIGNQGVNFLATLSAAFASAVFALAIGLAGA